MYKTLVEIIATVKDDKIRFILKTVSQGELLTNIEEFNRKFKSILETFQDLTMRLKKQTFAYKNLQDNNLRNNRVAVENRKGERRQTNKYLSM